MPLVDNMDDAMLALAAHHVVPLPVPPKTSVEHATFTYQDERNAARTVRGIGFRGRCACGERSRVVASPAMARAWVREHLANVHRADEREAVSPADGTAA